MCRRALLKARNFRYVLGILALIYIVLATVSILQFKGLGYYYVNRNYSTVALELSEILYQKYMQKRRAYRELNPSQDNAWVEGVPIWDHFLPAFTCPFSVQRVGGIGDGGKWICGFEHYEKSKCKESCVEYSFGVGKDSKFEAELLIQTNCDVFAFDGTVSGMDSGLDTDANPRLRFSKTIISDKEGEDGFAYTLSHTMKMNNHTWIDILKMDIDGAEFEILNQIMDEFDFLPFGQLSIDLHVDNAGKMLPKFYTWWERLEEKGLRAFMNELNFHPVLSWNQRPWAMEYSFVNVRHGRSLFYVKKA